MNALVSDAESTLRLAVFLGVLLVLALLEWRFPRRPLRHSKLRRWFSNFGISFLNTVTVRLLLPIVGVGAALLAAERGWGLFNVLTVPAWLSIPLFLLLFDLTIYFQHRLFHMIPVLWRLHRMHHTDLDYDVSTGNRFHPLSILLSSLIKLTLTVALGPPAVAVMIAEVLLNATSMFNHSNLRLPAKLDSGLRQLVVTPDMHRVHHSMDETEHNCNFGFNFPWWDRMFGTYLAQPRLGHDAMQIGIAGFEDDRTMNLSSLLAQPFQDNSSKRSQPPA
ncbi:MAG: sterol desaturase family protein [Pseudohongiellaceae bacterium]